MKQLIQGIRTWSKGEKAVLALCIFGTVYLFLQVIRLAV